VPAPRARGANLPNWISAARIAAIPPFVYLALRDGDGAAIAALALFVAASLSDSLDGHLARKHGSISRLGQFLDPTADKLLVGAALYAIVDGRDFPLWAALVIAVREVAVQILRTRIVAGGGTLPASSLGKVKTVAQVTMVSWWLLPWTARNPGHWVLLGVALAITLWSGAEYLASTRVASSQKRAA
jgi:CDP-diacylglycerol--glycerol-3-phosphate 3-phosphatidyltransferase